MSLPRYRRGSRVLRRALASLLATGVCLLLPVAASAVAPTGGTAAGAATFTLTSAASGTIYSVDSYGAAGNGTTDDSGAIQAAYDAAVVHAAAGSPATVAFTPGKIYFVSRGVTLDVIRTNDYWDPGIDGPRAGSTVARSGTVTFEGTGATIKYADNGDRYCWLQTPRPTAAGDTYGDLVIDGFTIDYNHRAPTATCGSVFWFGGSCNLDHLTIKNVTTTANLADHMGNGAGNNPNRNVLGVSIKGTGHPAHDNYFTNITISDCNVTAQSQCFYIDGNDKCVLDRINVDGCTTNNLGFAGSSMMLGGAGMGWRVSVSDCDCSNSDDDGVEIDAFNDVTVRGCSFHRIRQAILFTRFGLPYKSTVPDYTVSDCHYSGDCGPYWQQGQANGGVRSPMMPEIRSNQNGVYATPPNWGNITIEDCTGQWNSYSIHCAFFTLNAPMNSVTIKDCDITDTGTMIQIGQKSGAGTLPITISGCRKRASTSASYVPLEQGDCSFSGAYALTFSSSASSPFSVTSFNPSSGSVGTSVTITGTGFTAAGAVSFDGAAAVFSVDSDTQITATVPSGAASGPIAVTTPDGTATSTASFAVISAPTLVGLLPIAGAPGSSVILSGTGFSGAGAVSFNGAAAGFRVDSDTQITATVPSGATSGPVSVTAPGGTATSATSFTVTGTVAPQLTLSISDLTNGAITLGRSVTLTGTVAPVSLAGSSVTLTVQRKSGTSWVAVTTHTATISSSGAYSSGYKPGFKGAVRVQAAMAATTSHAAASTAWMSFMVQ